MDDEVESRKANLDLLAFTFLFRPHESARTDYGPWQYSLDPIQQFAIRWPQLVLEVFRRFRFSTFLPIKKLSLGPAKDDVSLDAWGVKLRKYSLASFNSGGSKGQFILLLFWLRYVRDELNAS